MNRQVNLDLLYQNTLIAEIGCPPQAGCSVAYKYLSPYVHAQNAYQVEFFLSFHYTLNHTDIPVSVEFSLWVKLDVMMWKGVYHKDNPCPASDWLHLSFYLKYS